ncbi:hypothetical protein ZIOFF_006649 [Zingiber officinale]|uniref:AB hydrolase-1 domain-containing protein n=1 Tax=Zingiber officinale TaxID=94328 RepID=A0A8J5M304_ZINOF|nr:hypothetical protein ZIOFF_006649 [Zingiber officinale]
MADAASDHSSRHIVLVHGTCHGAWSWHRVTTRLRSAGHRVTALDLAASGVDERRFADYNQPLVDVLASFPTRVLLVDHSLGGLNVALTTDKFPDKVAAGVFVTALLPDTLHPPSYVYCKVTPLRAHRTLLYSIRSIKFCSDPVKLKLDDPTMPFWLDTRSGDEEKGPLSLLFGPKSDFDGGLDSGRGSGEAFFPVREGFVVDVAALRVRATARWRRCSSCVREGRGAAGILPAVDDLEFPGGGGEGDGG